MGCFQPLESTQSLWVPSPTPHCIDTVSPHDSTARQGRGIFSALSVLSSLLSYLHPLQSYIQKSCLFAGVRRKPLMIVGIAVKIGVSRDFRDGGLEKGALSRATWLQQRVCTGMPSRFLCNAVRREDAKPSPDLASRLFFCVPLHNICYGIRKYVLFYFRY
jgi:hypothetical protein